MDGYFPCLCVYVSCVCQKRAFTVLSPRLGAGNPRRRCFSKSSRCSEGLSHLTSPPPNLTPLRIFETWSLLGPEHTKDWRVTDQAPGILLSPPLQDGTTKQSSFTWVVRTKLRSSCKLSPNSDSLLMLFFTVFTKKLEIAHCACNACIQLGGSPFWG